MGRPRKYPPPFRQPLLPVERLVLSYFGCLADAIGLPRSLAHLYGVLFITPGPLSFDEVVERSGVSQGAVSTGLRQLRRLGGVEIVVNPEDRRTFYRPVTSMRRLVGNFLTERLEPSVAEGARLLGQATAEADTAAGSDHLRARIGSLLVWHQRASELLPALHLLRAASPVGEGGAEPAESNPKPIKPKRGNRASSPAPSA